MDLNALGVAGTGQQQRAKELAGSGGIDVDRSALQVGVARQREGKRVAAADAHTKGSQRTEDRGHWSRVRLLVPIESDGSIGESSNRGNKAHHRPSKPAVDGAFSDEPVRWGDPPLPSAFFDPYAEGA